MSRMIRATSLSLLVAALLVPAGAFASGFDAGGPLFIERPGEMEFTGRLIARLYSPQEIADREGLGLRAARLRTSEAQARLTPLAVETIAATGEIVFNVPAGTSETEYAATLLATGDYAYVEPDWYVYPVRTPNDPRFGNQWHHETIESERGWDITTGSPSVIIAICDTGCDLDHPDLAGNRVSGYNSPSNQAESQGGQVADINGHGSATAGTAAAIGNNGVGVAGVGWDLRHMTIRVSNSSGGGASISDLTRGARWGIDNGAKVSSVSYSGVESSSVQSTGAYIRDQGGHLVWAAGNENRTIGGDHADVIVVGATTSGDTKASFSNTGSMIDCVAPGVGIQTTNRFGGYESVNGTSFSCPMTAGVLAMIHSAAPGLTPEQAESFLLSGCDDLGAAGDDAIFGAGRINLANSLSLIDVMSLTIDPAPIQAQQNATITVTNADPNADTAVFYSLRGEGSTFIPELGVSVDLINAKAATVIATSDSTGFVEWTVRAPRVPRALVVWMQAAQETGRTSNTVVTQINP